MVSTRLWLGGAISPHRDKALIQAIADQVRWIALCRLLLLAVDDLPRYVKAFGRAFWSKIPRLGQPGRCSLRSWAEVAIVQVVKERVGSSLTIHRRITQGGAELVERLIQTSQGHGGINAAFIERLNATLYSSRWSGAVNPRCPLRAVAIQELGPEESAPVLKKYFNQVSITRPYFDVRPDASVSVFVVKAPRPPVFRRQS